MIRRYSIRLINLAALFFYFVFKIVISGWSVGWSVVAGYRGDRGTLIEYKPVVESPWAIVLLFNIISMTPGSLSVDISSDRRSILVHLLRESDIDDFMRVTGRIERMLLRIFSEQPALLSFTES